MLQLSDQCYRLSADQKPSADDHFKSRVPVMACIVGDEAFWSDVSPYILRRTNEWPKTDTEILVANEIA